MMRPELSGSMCEVGRAMRTLGSLIAPMPVDRFIAEVWERNHLHVRRNDPGYFNALFTLDDLDAILARDNLCYPAIQVFLNGEQLPSAAFTRTWRYGRQSYRELIDVGRVYDLFDRGATLNILSLERLSANIGAINRGLEVDTGFPVHTTAFLTPCNSSNIPPHYDMVDFFTLQISGTKRWRLWRNNVGLPIVEDKVRTYAPNDPAVAEDRRIANVELRPGDTLFVPRGMIHRAITTKHNSLHVTVGINPYRRWDALETLVQLAVSALTQVREARCALPPLPCREVPSTREAGRHRVGMLVDVLARELDVRRSEAFQALAERLVSSRYPARPSQLVALAKGVCIDPHTLVRRRADMLVSLNERGERWRLEFQNKSLSLGQSLGLLIRAAQEADTFRPLDLPGSLSLSEKCAFVERLVKEGYLELVSTNAPLQ